MSSDPVLLAGRNAFIVLFVVLFGLSVYQFVYGDSFLAGALWTLGAVVFYASRIYYNRQADEEAATDEATT